MVTRSKIVSTTVFAVVGLAFWANVSAALRSLSVSGGPNVSASSRLTFGEREGGGALPRERQFICNVTLLKTVGSLIAKTAGALLGRVTGMAIELRGCESPLGRIEEIAALRTEGARSCTVAEPVLCTINWNLVYDSISGTLPTITAINYHIERAAIHLRVGGISCLWSGEWFVKSVVEAGRSVRTSESVLERTALRKTEEFLCQIASSNPASFSGRFVISPTLTVRLV